MVNNNQNGVGGTRGNGDTAQNHHNQHTQSSQGGKKTLRDKQQSTQERRELRKEYRSLIQDVQASKNELILPSSDGLIKTLNKSDQLYKNVHQAREAVLDSELLSLTSQYGFEQAQKFKVTLNSFDSLGFLARIKDRLVKCSNDAKKRNREQEEEEEEDGDNDDITSKGWDLFSKQFSSHFHTIPTFDFMYGPIDLEPPEKKKVERKKLQKDQPVGEVVQAENVTDTNTQVETETTSSRVQCMKRYLEKKPNIDFVDLVTDKQFSQTVENVFYFSFLLKDGHVKIKKDNNLSIETTQPPDEKDYQSRTAKPTHAVIRLDYKTWEAFKDHSTQEFDMEEELKEFKKLQQSQQPQSEQQKQQNSQRPSKKSKH